MAFAISSPERHTRTKARRVQPFPINLERCVALALNVAAWAVIWTVGRHLIGR